MCESCNILVRPRLYEVFKQDRVTDVSTVEAFLNRYYKPERSIGRGDDYAASLLRCLEKEMVDYGYAMISRHDSVVGRTVTFYPKGG
jgi:hypothetical protein